MSLVQITEFAGNEDVLPAIIEGVQILMMRRGELEVSEIGRFVPFLAELAKTMRPLLQPTRDLQAIQLGVDPSRFVQGEERSGSAPDTWEIAEVFMVDGGLLVIGASKPAQSVRYIDLPDGGIRRTIGESDVTRVEMFAFVPTLEMARSILDSISRVASASLGIELKDYYYANRDFESIRQEAVVEELPDTDTDLRAARTLADRTSRTLAVSIKSSRGLLVRDMREIVDSGDSVDLVDNLIAGGVASREVVIVCGASQTQIARVPDKKSLAKLAKDGLRCACGKPIDQESAEDLITITDVGALLLDKSRWLSVLVRHELMALGVPSADILLECQLGSDEIDCIAKISGELAMFELKDKEFSMGNAYSFSAKMSVIKPKYSIIVSTDKVDVAVKGHFARAGRNPRGPRRTTFSGVRAEPSINYVEGDSFASGIRDVVCKIYRVDARTALQNALETAILNASFVLTAISDTYESPDDLIEDDAI